MNKTIDPRYTYICTYCCQFAELLFCEIEVFDSGTTLICDKCGESTVMLLLTPPDYAEAVARDRNRAVIGEENNDDSSIGDERKRK